MLCGTTGSGQTVWGVIKGHRLYNRSGSYLFKGLVASPVVALRADRLVAEVALLAPQSLKHVEAILCVHKIRIVTFEVERAALFLHR